MHKTTCHSADFRVEPSQREIVAEVSNIQYLRGVFAPPLLRIETDRQLPKSHIFQLKDCNERLRCIWIKHRMEADEKFVYDCTPSTFYPFVDEKEIMSLLKPV
jgi:hypothetical protein